MQKRIFCALAMIVAGAAAAQNAPQANPRDPKAPVPPLEYRSAFADYRPYKEPEVAPWRDANEEVGRVGGHLGIVRGQQEAAKAGPKPPMHGMQHK
ncbi:MAG: hypothetical protein EPO20_01160 [Betaproteobacteria bacterium]|nr:MAG: hypothetical protein EPO20_01160 [Betaproteobacteria bacterium]